MYFLGSGALLHRAVNFTLNAGLAVSGACCPPGDGAVAAVRRLGVSVLESDDPNADLPRYLDLGWAGTVFSINNRHILGAELLGAGARFFNIHAGLVQKYRGIGEICMFAALCRGEDRYGVTLHEVLSGQRVDCGPVVAQIDFPVLPQDGFASVLERSLDACQKIFEARLEDIAVNRQRSTVVATAERSLSYRDVAALCRAADPARLRIAADLGRYAGLFPRLAALLDAARNERCIA